MIQIDDLIKKIKINDLKDGKIIYNDKLENNEFKETIGINYWLSKYYNGSISKEEHNKCKEDSDLSQQLCHLIKIYDNIFEDTELDGQIEEEELDVLSQLWIMRPRNNFEYEENFKKIIYNVYVKTDDIRFREIALDYYKQNITNKSEDKRFLICSSSKSDDYNKTYGIDEKIIDKTSQDSNNSKKEDVKKDDWISNLFLDEGGNNG